jgi:hypothetical protein
MHSCSETCDAGTLAPGTRSAGEWWLGAAVAATAATAAIPACLVSSAAVFIALSHFIPVVVSLFVREVSQLYVHRKSCSNMTI